MATLMPLYSGSISRERAAVLVKVMEDAYLVYNPLPAAERPTELELVRAQAILARSDVAEHELVRHRWLEAVRIRRPRRSTYRT